MRLAAAALFAGLVLVGGSTHAHVASLDPDPVFPVGAISDATSHQITRLDQIASKLAGRKAIVNCWSLNDWKRFQAWQSAHHYYRLVDAGGVAFPKTRRIQLLPFACEVLAQVLAGPLDQPLWDAGAITLVAHESAHVSGLQAENRAECQAIKTEPEAATLFGVSRATGVKFQHIYRGTLYTQETAQYNRPACSAGLPGVVAPDTLGPPAAVHVVRRFTTAALPFLPHWTSIGGSYGFGPLSPCGLVSDRSNELARFNESFVKGTNDWFGVQGVTVRTSHEYSLAVTRTRAFPRCELAHRRAGLRATGSHETIALGRAPKALSGLSPDVDPVRFVYRSGSQSWDIDQITVLDRAARSAMTLYIGPGIPVSDQVNATKATLRAMHESS